jgi:PhnB protein
MTKVQAVPKGFHTLTPHLIIRGAADAVEFYKQAFGAEEIVRMLSPERKILHAELQIGDSIIFICEEMPQMGCNGPEALGGTPVTIHIYVDDVDTLFNCAVMAGATVTMPVNNMFWGDRYGKLSDPFGHNWSIASKVEELTGEEIQKRQEAFFKEIAQTRK